VVIATSVLLLAVGVAGALIRPRGLPAWCLPLAGAVVALGLGNVDLDVAADALRPLRDPLAFLLLSVPLAALLDQLGVFDAVARRCPARYLAGSLWAVGAVVVALLNLDAAVVLLTPLAVRVARRTGLDPVAMAFQPALLACLASSALPVSNLTNLILAEDRSTGEFLGALGLPTLVAVVVGYLCWRRAFRGAALVPARASGSRPGDPRALAIGAVVAVVLTIGFTAGRAVGVEAWVVVAAVVVVLVAMARMVPVRSVPGGAALVAASLAVLAAAVGRHVDLGSVIGSGEGPAGIARVTAVGAGLANASNNLPAFLVGRPALPPTDAATWAWLLGVNMGPTLLVTASLSGLLWRETMQREGVPVSAVAYLRVGLRVGLPALVAATAVLAWTA
jgi:arsenical pump membrane protein